METIENQNPSMPEKKATHRSEEGHAINVANLEKIVADITSLLTAYNPSKASIKPSALNLLLTNSKNAMALVLTADSNNKLAVSARIMAFNTLDSLVPRILYAIKASDVNEHLIENAVTIIRKLQGRRAKAKLSNEQKATLLVEGKTIIEHSSSQLSFDNRIENFDKLIKLLTTIATYIPNEADLKITALNTLLTDLRAKNSAVINAKVALTNARIARNDLLYKEKTGLTYVAQDIKTYIKSVYGTTSSQYKAISQLKFTKTR